MFSVHDRITKVFLFYYGFTIYLSGKWPLWVSKNGSENLSMAIVTEIITGEMAVVKELMHHRPLVEAAAQNLSLRVGQLCHSYPVQYKKIQRKGKKKVSISESI